MHIGTFADLCGLRVSLPGREARRLARDRHTHPTLSHGIFTVYSHRFRTRLVDDDAGCGGFLLDLRFSRPVAFTRCINTQRERDPDKHGASEEDQDLLYQ